MTWIIGIDEAGYGPNLGPFVMTAVACRLPDDDAGCDLWKRLDRVVRRDDDPEDDRLLVADSKVVYTPARGLSSLETAVLGASAPGRPNGSLPLADYLDHLCPSTHDELRREAWYRGTTPLPTEATAGACRLARERFSEILQTENISIGLVRSITVCPERFNALTEQAGSKGAVLQHGLAELVRACWELAGDGEGQAFFIDKHGGRNTYAAMLQDAVPEGMIVAVQESAARSVYRVHGLQRDVRWTFQPRADAEHFCVALASMVSKYVREVLMAEFNRFWQEQVPDLEPTAGYPLDARRFLDAIRPAMTRLGIADSAVWRRK
jgi:ribonuclease HII